MINWFIIYLQQLFIIIKCIFIHTHTVCMLTHTLYLSWVDTLNLRLHSIDASQGRFYIIKLKQTEKIAHLITCNQSHVCCSFQSKNREVWRRQHITCQTRGWNADVAAMAGSACAGKLWCSLWSLQLNIMSWRFNVTKWKC